MSIDPLFRMTVEDVFNIKGRGTVATGRIASGSLKVGDEVEIVRASGDRKRAIVAGLEMLHKKLSEARAGDNVGILLRDVSKSELQPGDVLTASSASSASLGDFSWKP